MSAMQDLLSERECLEILRKSLKLNSIENVNVLNYQIERGSADLLGFMGEYYKLSVQAELKQEKYTKQLQYFIKSVPITNKPHRDECVRKGFFDKETRIYTDILPNIQRYAPTMLFPECFYTRADIIVLEDLFAKGKEFFHLDMSDYTMAHHQLVLQHQAKLHAASIAWEVNEGINIGELYKDVLVEMQLSMKNEWYVTGIKGIVFLAKMHPKYQTPAEQTFIADKLYGILSNAEALMDPSRTLRNVLCHRDSWTRNIFFKNNAEGRPNDCRFVDFQLTRYSPPAIDVLFLLYTTTTHARRALIFDDCINFYYDALSECLESMQLSAHMMSRADFLQALNVCRLPILIIWAICEPLMRMPEGLSNKMRAEEPEKFDYYMNSKRDEMFMRVMEVDAGYKDTIMLPIEELMECIFEHESVKHNIVI